MLDRSRQHCERKGEEGPVRSLHVPSHVPSYPQNAAKVPGFSRTVSAFTAETDCLLEQAEFEPSVPLFPWMLPPTGSPITAKIDYGIGIPLTHPGAGNPVSPISGQRLSAASAAIEPRS